MGNKKFILSVLVGLVAVGVLGVTNVFAAEQIGTVTAPDGHELQKVAMNAQVTAVNGSSVSIVDTQSGETYSTSFGPARYSGTYNVGDEVKLEAVLTEGQNSRGHNLLTLKVNDTELRSGIGQKPNWAGSSDSGLGSKQRQHNNGDCAFANN